MRLRLRAASASVAAASATRAVAAGTVYGTASPVLATADFDPPELPELLELAALVEPPFAVGSLTAYVFPSSEYCMVPPLALPAVTSVWGLPV